MLKPLGDRILVKRESGKKKTDGGIIIPDAYVEKSEMGIVVDFGQKKTDTGIEVDMGVEIGDKVIFRRKMGTEIKINKEDYVLLESYDVFAIIEE